MGRRLAAALTGRRTKWMVLLAWIALLVPAFLLAGRLGEVQQNDISAWLAKHSESAQYFARAGKFQPSDTMPAIVVYERQSGLTAADLAKVKADATAFQAIPDVNGTIADPVVADDNKAVETIVPVKVGRSGWTGIAQVVDRLTAIADRDAEGLTNHVTGPGGYAADSGRVFGGATSLMIVAVIAVVVILLLTYRSPVLWVLPVITAVVALFAAEAVVYLLARGTGVVVNAQTSFILSVLVFGAATDYALLLISRYREELRRRADRHEAMAEALYRSAPAIVASAATVAISLLVLLLAMLNSTRGLGPVCAAGILVGLVAMLTLMPALLVIFGRWIFWPVRPTYGSPRAARTGIWSRIGTAVSARPRVIWVGTALVLGAMALGVSGLDAHGIPPRNQFTMTTPAVVGEQVHQRHFRPGSGNPMFLVTKAATADQVRLALSVTPGIDTVVLLDTKGDEAFILATPKYPAGTAAALDVAARARAAVHSIVGADPRIGGGSATDLDIQNTAARDSRVVIPVVVIVVFLILALLLRSLVAPLLLMLTVVLSFGAALGVSALMFRHVFHFAGVDAAFPLQAFTFLVALGIDYNIFLVTRVREEAQRSGTRRGALAGLSATGAVITSAGLVLAGTFATLGSLPMVFSAELGFAVAFGVLLDTFVVRSVLVTALTLDVGRWMWWPSKLSEPHRRIEPEAPSVVREPVLAGR